MKVTNITKDTNNPQELSVPLLKKGGGNVNISLKPGEYIFIEERANNSTLRVYEKKRIIGVSEDEKPEALEYYIIYNDDKANSLSRAYKSIKNTITTLIKGTPEAEKEIDAASVTPVESVEDNKIVVETNEIEIEVIVPEGSIVNKGGRPKGAKNKSKKGRPKKKKAIGRPKKKK